MKNDADNYEIQVSTEFVHSEWFDWTAIHPSRIVMRAGMRMVYADIYGDFGRYESFLRHSIE